MTGVSKIGKEGGQKTAAKKTKSNRDVVEAVKEEIFKQFPGYSSYHAIKLAKLLAENKDKI